MSSEDFEAIKSYTKDKFDSDRKRFLSDAILSDDGQWLKHSEFHWSRNINGSRLDYWPSRRKFQFKGKVRRGDVYSLINLENGKMNRET